MPTNPSDAHGVVVRLDVPPSSHPAVIKGDTPGAKLGRSALTSLYDAYGKINDTAARVSDKSKLAVAAQPFAERAIHAAEQVTIKLTAQIAHHDASIAKALAVPVEPNLAGQIRSHFAANGKALQQVHKLIAEGDAVTMAAVLNAPSYLSGLDDKQQGVLRLEAAKRFAPDAVQAREESAAALGRVETAGAVFVSSVGDKLREWSNVESDIIKDGLS